MRGGNVEYVSVDPIQFHSVLNYAPFLLFVICAGVVMMVVLVPGSSCTVFVPNLILSSQYHMIPNHYHMHVDHVVKSSCASQD